MKLIILDRDGVINLDRPDYVKSAAECIPIAGSIAAMVRLHQAGFTLVIATNQSGLARGKFDLDELEAMHAKITQLIVDQGGELAAIFYCPHAPEDNCKCRKPQTGMLDAIEAEFNTSVASCFFIGDSLRDLQAGLRKDCVPILVKTGNGLQTLQQLENMGCDNELVPVSLTQIHVVADLAAAAELAINSLNENL